MLIINKMLTKVNKQNCAQYLVDILRPYMFKQADRFPMQNYLRIVYNDALTFDSKTKKGGL